MDDPQSFWMLNPLNLWGDYGSILAGGFTTSPWQDEAGRLLLQRTGPYVPAAAYSNSGFVVVTDTCREQLLRDFPDVRLKPVVKHQIVELHWEQWSRDGDMAEELPDDHEPESYVLHGEHSEECARAMPDLWELDLDEGIRSSTSRHPAKSELTVDPSTWTGAHFLITIPNVIPIHLVTDTGKQWLLEHASDGFSFRETILGSVEPRASESGDALV